MGYVLEFCLYLDAAQSLWLVVDGNHQFRIVLVVLLMVVAGLILLLVFLYGVRCFCPVLDGSGRVWPERWLEFSISDLI